ncbi:Uncharacterised protein [Bordetella pertussis]|nr:Uncharacterised protein [Bordetella pertussis]CFW05179.1 Uncharacterised protein [Bordetella pertussis]CFW47442.1 Uncharacterised protein [Bordetella pertussis]
MPYERVIASSSAVFMRPSSPISLKAAASCINGRGERARS